MAEQSDREGGRDGEAAELNWRLEERRTFNWVAVITGLIWAGVIVRWLLYLKGKGL